MAALDAETSLTISDKVRQCTVQDKNGAQIQFGALLDHQPTSTKRLLLVFIRHFFCGNCQEYVRRLSSDFPPSALPEDISIAIIGCGASSLISSYIQVTGCSFPIYSDPSTSLYKHLGMHRTLSLGKKGPSYIRHSLVSGAVQSIVQGIKRIPSGDVLQAGDMHVNGGEFLLERINGTGATTTSTWDVLWSHCMMNTRDHTEIHDLKRCILESDCSSASDAFSGSGISI